VITNKNTQKVVLITGASSGIGEATARLLAHKGLRVVLGARRTNRLEAIVSEIRTQGGVAEYRALDVTSLEDMQAFVNFAKHQFGLENITS
jgi:NADP-dependent 3-hydroxy acid dehydrogenase YdfG